MNLLEAICIANATCQSFSQSTVSNYFHHARFLRKQACETEPVAEGLQKTNTENEDFNHLIQALLKHVVSSENVTFENYVAIDVVRNWEKEFLEDDLIRTFYNPGHDSLNNSSDDEIIKVLETPPTLTDAKKHIKYLQNFFGRQQNSNYFWWSMALKAASWNFSRHHLKQKVIASLFKKC